MRSFVERELSNEMLFRKYFFNNFIKGELRCTSKMTPKYFYQGVEIFLDEKFY